MKYIVNISADSARAIIENELIASGASRLTSTIYAARILAALHKEITSKGVTPTPVNSTTDG